MLPQAWRDGFWFAVCGFLSARYQNELAGVDTELLAERFYYQALSVAPQIGELSYILVINITFH